MTVSENEPNNICNMDDHDKEAEISQNKKHHRKEDTTIMQETTFKANIEDAKKKVLSSITEKTTTILPPHYPTFHIANGDNAEPAHIARRGEPPSRHADDDLDITIGRKKNNIFSQCIRTRHSGKPFRIPPTLF